MSFVREFLLGASGPLLLAFAMAAGDVMRRWFRARRVLWFAYVLLACGWVSVMLPATNRSEFGRYHARAMLAEIVAGPAIGAAWLLWHLVAARPLPMRRGFPVVGDNAVDDGRLHVDDE